MIVIASLIYHANLSLLKPGYRPDRVVTIANNAMNKKNSCVSIYLTWQATERALGDLRKAHVDLKKLSVVGRGYHGEAHPIGFYNIGERMGYWGHENDFWSGVLDLLSGAAFFWLPDFGPLTVFGSMVALLVRGLDGVAVGGGFTVFGAALYNMGIPRNSIQQYEQAVKAEQFLLIVHGQRDDVEQAFEILHSETQQVAVHRA